jgi:hypothetical protein
VYLYPQHRNMDPEELFVAPPGPDLLSEPQQRLLARVPGLDQAASALRRLRDVGLPTDQVYAICGREGIRRLDPTGRHHGLKGRLIRAAQFVTSYGELIEEDPSHLEGGGVILSLPAADPAERQLALETLRGHGATAVRYFADTTYEDLG